MPIVAFEIFIPCLLASILIDYGDKYYDNLCNLSWYLLSPSDKKSFTVLLIPALFPKSMSCGLMQMNLQMFVEVRQRLKVRHAFFGISTGHPSSSCYLLLDFL